jgi:hypothetical protein
MVLVSLAALFASSAIAQRVPMPPKTPRIYHYPEERTTGRVPTFEFNADQSRAARAKIEAFVKSTGARLWIEHDIATHVKLPKSPAFVE